MIDGVPTIGAQLALRQMLARRANVAVMLSVIDEVLPGEETAVGVAGGLGLGGGDTSEVVQPLC